MSKHFNETMRNAERYYERVEHNCTAKIINGNGFTAHIDTTDRTYFVSTRIDKNAELVIMEISPAIHCSKEARSQVSEYINKINATFKCGNLRIESNGNIYMHTEQRFDDAPLSSDMFGIMEKTCMVILDTFELIIEKLAHMKLLEPDEADIEKVIKIYNEKKRMSLAEETLFDDDEDDDDDDTFVFHDIDDDDDEIEIRHPRIPEPPGFTEWLRKRLAEKSAAKNNDNDNDDEEKDDDDDKEKDKASPDEKSDKSLFDEIAALQDDDEDEEDEEPGTTVTEADEEDTDK